MSFRTYNQVSGDDRSQLLAQVVAQRDRVRARLETIHHIIAVISGKGGVGKSYVTAAIARELAGTQGLEVGVLDADLKSPTTARLLGAPRGLRVTEDGVHPARGDHEIRVMSMDLMLDEGAPLRWTSTVPDSFVWRETLETGTLREFLSDTIWGELDVLLVDMPPDADRIEDLAELVPALGGAVAVTLPSAESRRSVERAIRCAHSAGVRVLGIVENMSGYACDSCAEVRQLFPGNAGEHLAAAFDVPVLAKLSFSSTRKDSGCDLASKVMNELSTTRDPQHSTRNTRPPTRDPRPDK